MTFSDINFLLIFILIFVPIYAILPQKVKPYILLFGGILFYAINDIRVLLVLLVDIIVVYAFGRITDTAYNMPKTRKAIVIIGITIQLILMLLSILVFRHHAFIGVGFFTIQLIGYYLDIYRNNIYPSRNLLTFANYVLFFPKVLQGPIVNYESLSLELEYPETVSAEKLEKGLRTFILGISLKILIADHLSFLWNGVQTVGFQSISTPLAWLSMYSYSMQLYFDFQGYSLMAIGVAQMLGYTLPINFRSPYLSKSISEFYRRWHMTLGDWFKNYIYIPMGGSKNGALKTVLSLSVVWILTGLWHGITINFMMWALTLLFFIILEKFVLKKIIKSKNIFASIFCHLYVLLVIPMTWIMFAISSPEQIGIFFTRLFGLTSICEPLLVNNSDYINYLKDYAPFLIGGVFCCFPFMEDILIKTRIYMTRFISFALFWLCIYMVMKNGNNPFMYINF